MYKLVKIKKIIIESYKALDAQHEQASFHNYFLFSFHY